MIGSKQFAQLQAISYSVSREKAPVYTMGSADPRAFSRNKRGIAGTLIWINFDRHALLDVFYQTAGKFVGNADDAGRSTPGFSLPPHEKSRARPPAEEIALRYMCLLELSAHRSSIGGSAASVRGRERCVGRHMVGAGGPWSRQPCHPPV